MILFFFLAIYSFMLECPASQSMARFPFCAIFSIDKLARDSTAPWPTESAERLKAFASANS
jgi:hypothetical protein